MRRLLCTLGILTILPFLPAAAVSAADAKGEKETTKAASKPRLAVFQLATGVTESEVEDPLSFGPAPVTLRELVARLKKAAADPEGKAVVLLPEGGGLGP